MNTKIRTHILDHLDMILNNSEPENLLHQEKQMKASKLWWAADSSWCGVCTRGVRDLEHSAMISYLGKKVSSLFHFIPFHTSHSQFTYVHLLQCKLSKAVKEIKKMVIAYHTQNNCRAILQVALKCTTLWRWDNQY